MSKRKQIQDEDEDDGNDVNIVDVDFEFFDPNPKVDYHAIKRLLIQLFQSDAEALHVTELTELILSQPLVGTTVKLDGIESDPYALLTVLNMHVHQDHPSIQALREYILHKAETDQAFHETVRNLLAPNSRSHVGLIICERVVNMPVQIVPPMYRMLMEEIKWAVNDNEPYVFSHFLIISRAYRLSREEEEENAAGPRTKRARKQEGPADGVYSFHPEDEQILEGATNKVTYSFSGSAEPREKDGFGLDTRGRLMLVTADGLGDVVRRIAEEYRTT